MVFGSINVFKPENEQWLAFVEWLEQFFEANDKADGEKVAILLSVMAATTYRLSK